MKTDNFKLSFKENFLTEITFGNARFLIGLLDEFPIFEGDESFFFQYELNGVAKIVLYSDNLPCYYRILIRSLFYGHFAYDKSPFYKSPALECITIKRSIENYLIRVNKPLINSDVICV